MATQYKRPCFLEGWVPADSQFKKARLSKCVPAPRPYRSRRVSSFVSRRRLKTWCNIYLCIREGIMAFVSSHLSFIWLIWLAKEVDFGS